ncbi:hypothetical protein Rsub_07028 [Raphidocelis subcapitata]|uniref:WW domain-containing protein n=1 Tax=Raphidocelis subcapitata TaxID=307507 RepID=A0A2V0P3Q5_9CHLO|nr:hypothetical protein Rsub_07028 [Raphidocelis subcapitata]|eukprot:GBF94494.1 hypothetical protein Rsub_07028 [Raphidocelis subcapitata]
MAQRGACLARLLQLLQQQQPQQQLGGWGAPLAVALCNLARSPAVVNPAASAGRGPLLQQQQWRGYSAAEKGGALQTTEPPPGEQAEQQQQLQQQAQEQQQQPARGAAESDWTEVVDEQTGQTYFWNESTGETTELGEPRPRARFRDSSFPGGGDARFQEGWREPPGSDRTHAYSAIGAIIGLTAGWATQFLH